MQAGSGVTCVVKGRVVMNYLNVFALTIIMFGGGKFKDTFPHTHELKGIISGLW